MENQKCSDIKEHKNPHETSNTIRDEPELLDNSGNVENDDKYFKSNSSTDFENSPPKKENVLKDTDNDEINSEQKKIVNIKIKRNV